MLTEPMAVFVKTPVKLSFEQPVSIIIAVRHDKSNFFIYRPFSEKFCKMRRSVPSWISF